MMNMNWIVVLWFAFILTGNAHARGMSGAGGREDNFMVANGQGISSPSFFGALHGENPAGLVLNQTLKLQGGMAAISDSTATLRESGALLVGNGYLGAGAEYAQYNSGAYASGTGVINFGAAGMIPSMATTFGISGHSDTGGGGSSYDFGMFFEFIQRLRIAAMMKNLTHGIGVVGAGLMFNLDPMVDLVLDADSDIKNSLGVVKPGLSLHTDRIHFTASYGYRYRGLSDALLYSKFSAGLGIRISENFLVEYQYRTLPQHLLGLTLRLN